MATIDKKLIHFNRKADFEARLAAGDIRDYSIVCIKDAKLIWTHGQYYGDLSECLTKYPQEFTKEEKDQMLENLGYYFIEWDRNFDSIELSEEEYAKFSASTIPLLVADGIIFYPITVMQGYGAIYKSETGSGSMTFAVYAEYPPVLSIIIEEINIPSKTSDLENDSNFVSAVNTGEEVDGVEADYVTEAAMNAALSSKQDNLVSGTSIKTINGESILGSGDIIIGSVTEDYVNNAIAQAITTTLNTEV